MQKRQEWREPCPSTYNRLFLVLEDITLRVSILSSVKPGSRERGVWLASKSNRHST